MQPLWSTPGVMKARFPILAAALALTALVSGHAVAADGFVDGLPDLPLMPGLRNVTGETVVFDKPQGRIIQSLTRGAVAPAAVRAFYAETAPQLGWRPTGDNRFARDGEVLRLDVQPPSGYRAGQGEVTVRFTLIPE